MSRGVKRALQPRQEQPPDLDLVGVVLLHRRYLPAQYGFRAIQCIAEDPGAGNPGVGVEQERGVQVERGGRRDEPFGFRSPEVRSDPSEEGENLFRQAVLTLAMASQTKDQGRGAEDEQSGRSPTRSPVSIPPKVAMLFLAPTRSMIRIRPQRYGREIGRRTVRSIARSCP
jgi:hypothetical protein